MTNVESYRQYAVECVRQAEGEDAPEAKNILLNVALAWVRLAHQTRNVDEPEPAAETGAPHDQAALAS
jgi:hypothetical protein